MRSKQLALLAILLITLVLFGGVVRVSAKTGAIFVKDIQAGSFSSDPDPGGAVIGSNIYFAANDGQVGRELWRSDGTAEGTVLVKDIDVGDSSSYPVSHTVLGSTFYFYAQDHVHGIELWRSDGSTFGTTLVKDINPYSSGCSPHLSSVAINSVLYFPADDDTHGLELWRTDGSEMSTVMVKDINPGTASSLYRYSTNILEAVGTTLYFRADDGTHGLELWRTDGTEEGTVLVKDINPGSASSLPHGMSSPLVTPPQCTAVLNGVVYFTADDGVHGFELWRSDGTDHGTTMVKDINPTQYYPPWVPVFPESPSGLISHNNSLFFSTSDGIHGNELWSSDGTRDGTSLVRDIYPGSDSSGPFWQLVSFHSRLYFAADDETHGCELWESDGTLSGTRMVKDIYPGEQSSVPSRFKITVMKLFFEAEDGISGRELWESDGTAEGTRLVQDINPGSGSSLDPVSTMGVVGSTLFFKADDGINGLELWRTIEIPTSVGNSAWQQYE